MVKQTNANLRGIIYCFVHFSVEVACFWWMTAIGLKQNAWIIAFCFDALAFLPQIGFGALTDKFPKIPLAPIGLLMLLIGIFLPHGGNLIYLPLVFITIGNSLVHVEGAQTTLRGTGGKTAPSGIFVAGGSFGIIVGKILGVRTWDFVWIAFAFIIISLILTTVLHLKFDGSTTADGYISANVKGLTKTSKPINPLPIEIITLFVFFTVILRGYVGYAIPTAWNKTEMQAVMLYVFMGIGKGLGGILADLFGARRVSVISLCLSLPFLICGDNIMWLSLIGVMLFSMTMAISLGILVSIYDDRPGFAFGITTTGLFIGTLPAFFYQPTGTAQIIIIAVLTIIAAVLFFTSANNFTIKRKKGE